MFGNKKRQQTLKETVDLITSAGYGVSKWFNHEEYLQWEHSAMWSAFCGTIPAFALVVVCEFYRNELTELTAAQHEFLKVAEDSLFLIYRKYSEGKMVRIRDCLPLDHERHEFCNHYGISDETLVTMDMILGIIFPKRLEAYKKDWADGLASTRQDAPTVYPAMRLAADLKGIPTPRSLSDFGVSELGSGYGYAFFNLTEFLGAYTQKTYKR